MTKQAKSNPIFEVFFSVRDYECDLQGVVNNSVYQNYLEHTRHEYLKSIGINFAEVTEQGYLLVVKKAELDYRDSLRPGDEFRVELEPEISSKVRAVFHQRIVRQSDDKIMLSAKITATGIKPNGRLGFPQQFIEAVQA